MSIVSLELSIVSPKLVYPELRSAPGTNGVPPELTQRAINRVDALESRVSEIESKLNM